MRWVELAARALKVGAQSDLLYFYLGRASEGLGDVTAAMIYYRLAIDPKEFGLACAGIFNSCDGLVVPKLARDRSHSLQDEQREVARIEAERIATAEKSRQIAQAEKDTRLQTERELIKQREAAALFVENTEKAKQGLSEAQYSLAEMYFSGKGTAVDEKSGLMWLTKAAEQGYADAQYDLSERYLKGKAVSVNLAVAEIWFNKAMRQGHKDTAGIFAPLMSSKQERAVAAENVVRTRAASLAAAARKQDLEQEELVRKKKLENSAKLKAL